VFLAKEVQLETHTKKGDTTDPRLLVGGASSVVCSSCIIFLVYWQCWDP